MEVSSLPIDLLDQQPLSSGFSLAETPSSWVYDSVTVSGILETGAVFAAMHYHRLRLRLDQNLPEWNGLRS